MISEEVFITCKRIIRIGRNLDIFGHLGDEGWETVMKLAKMRKDGIIDVRGKYNVIKSPDEPAVVKRKQFLQAKEV